MNGAFHGVITTAGPAGMRCTTLSMFLASQRAFSVVRNDQVGVECGS